MLIRRNANIDVDEMERATGTLLKKARNEEDHLKAVKYWCAFHALDVLINGNIKSFEDLVVSIETRMFYEGLDNDDE